MPVPTTNVKFSDIYAEANGAYSSGILSLNTMSFFSYFAGPNGSNSQAANNWGQGEASGANKIYNTTAKTTNIKVGDFDGLYYFYDQTNYKCTLTVTNNLGPPMPFPPPGTNTDIQDVNLTLRDNSNTYSYLGAGTGPVNWGNMTSFDASTSFTPLIETAYWTITIGANPQFPACSADLTINGNTVFTGQAVSAGPTSTVFAFGTWGTYTMYNNGSNIGFDFALTVY